MFGNTVFSETSIDQIRAYWKVLY